MKFEEAGICSCFTLESRAGVCWIEMKNKCFYQLIGGSPPVPFTLSKYLQTELWRELTQVSFLDRVNRCQFHIMLFMRNVKSAAL